MCGFVVILSADGNTPDPALPNRMADLLSHRGPDDTGAFAEHGIAFAFRRLAIFDLTDAGHQPMISMDRRHVIVFNGAIYNFVELREELRALGHTFHTNGDTEVLLAAYQQWGAGCLRRLNGMWAFVIYDRLERRVFASRDRFGVKPLFWYQDKRGLAFVSEIKAIRDSGYASLSPNWRTIARFLFDESLDTDDETFYSEVRRMPAGSFFEGDAVSPPTFRRHWCLMEAAAALEEPADPVEQFRQVFEDSVRLRMRSDVPLGVLLSGGLDSTSIISTMAAQRHGFASSERLQALCYLDPNYDETPFIAATLKQTGASLATLLPDPQHLWDSLDRHLWHQDEPVHSFTSVVIYELMKLAHERGLKVLLNGQGADEVLAGYPSFFIDHWAELVRSGHPGFVHH
jgi:asparagine synthase (glutamine-hydrolysing)